MIMKEDRPSSTAQAQQVTLDDTAKSISVESNKAQAARPERRGGTYHFVVKIILFVVYVDLREGETEKSRLALSTVYTGIFGALPATRIRKMV